MRQSCAEQEQQQYQQFIKHCHVCGDFARNYNYGGLSCDSCKLFFFRNSNNNKELICKNNNQCLVFGKNNRKKCKKCRYERCLQIGMSKDNKYCKRKSYTNSQASTVIDDDHNQNINNINGSSVTNYSRSSPPSSLPSSSSSLPLQSSSLSSQLSPESPLKGSHTTACIQAVRQAVASNFVDENILPIVSLQVDSIVVGCNLTTNYIKKVIRFLKSFETYRNLSEEDQLYLLKRQFIPIVTIRYAFYYDSNIDSYPKMLTEEGTEVVYTSMNLFKQLDPPTMEDRYRTLFVALQQTMANDETIRDLSMLLVTYPFDGYSFSSSLELIRYQHHFAFYLLEQYLESKYSLRDAMAIANTLRTYTKQVRYLGEQLFLCVKTQFCGHCNQVLKELVN